MFEVTCYVIIMQTSTKVLYKYYLLNFKYYGFNQEMNYIYHIGLNQFTGFRYTVVYHAVVAAPLPWVSVHWLFQCTLECHWVTQCTLGCHWANKRILAGYTGTPLEKLIWNRPTLECHWRNLVETDRHWDATGEIITSAAYTGTPLGDCNSSHTPLHI